MTCVANAWIVAIDLLSRARPVHQDLWELPTAYRAVQKHIQRNLADTGKNQDNSNVINSPEAALCRQSYTGTADECIAASIRFNYA